MSYTLIPTTQRTRCIYEDCHPKFAEDAEVQPYRVEYGEYDALYDNGYYQMVSMSFVSSIRVAREIVFERIREIIEMGWGAQTFCVFDNLTNNLLEKYNSNDYKRKSRN